MIVCLCKAVCDAKIRSMGREGASVEEVADRCGAGTDCGTCLDTIADLIDEEAGARSCARLIRKEVA